MTTAELRTRERELSRELRALRKKIRSAQRIPKAKAPGRSKAERDAERDARAAEIRAEVMKRADGQCEWCHREGLVLQWAHVIDGSDKQAREDVDTTAGACADCHLRGWHGSGPRRMQTLRNALEWALRLGFKDAAREIERKIEKATPSVPVRIEVAS